VRRHCTIEDASLLADHDHVVCSGVDQEDLGHFVAPFFMAGTRHNDRMLYVVENPDHRRLTRTRGTGQLVRTGALEIADVDAVYAPSLDFDPDAQLGIFEDVLAEALAAGYSGLRIATDCTPLLAGTTAMQWLAWEHLADAFEAANPVIGVCFFDRCHTAPALMADLGALHPVRPTHAAVPAFQFFHDDGAVRVTGTLDYPSAAQLQRILAAWPRGAELVVELAEVEFVDRHALAVLDDAARSGPPLTIRHAGPTLRRLLGLLRDLGLPMRHLRVEE
jgi:anti-anti-sigma regulatory factor